MRQGSTPTNTFEVNIDLTGATVFVNYEQQGKMVIEKTGNALTISPDKIVLQLSQKETLSLKPGDVLIQIRYVFPNGAADASNIIRATVERIIKDGEIEYV